MSDDGARMQRVGRRVLLEKINFRVCSVRPDEIRLPRHRVNQIAGKFSRNLELAKVFGVACLSGDARASGKQL